MVNGVLNVLPVAGTENAVVVDNVIINGKVACNELRVEGMLAIKSTAVLKAQRIFYRQLVIETGAVVHGQMLHLDHVSEEGPEVVDSEARK
jgi:cytoskeletal protein CcmA (bactofilin family)